MTNSTMLWQTTTPSAINQDIFQYKDNVDELMKKLLLLEKVDFELSINGRMITEMVDHQEKPHEQTKENMRTHQQTRRVSMNG